MLKTLSIILIVIAVMLMLRPIFHKHDVTLFDKDQTISGPEWLKKD